MDPTQSQYEEEASVDPDTSTHYRQKNGSSSTVNQRAASVQVTPSTHRSTAGRHTAVVPQRTPSSATDASSVTPSLVTRFRNSVTVGGGSSSHHTERSRNPAGALRAHHGAVDPDMTTTRPPPEVIKHIKDVLLGMGIEVQLESEYKYRCIRMKKKKLPGTIGSVGGSGSLAAVTMMGTAASNGPVYGDTTEDVGDEVRFSVELTKMTGLSDTFSLDIRRLKGNLRSYKFLYDTIRLYVASLCFPSYTDLFSS
ncbi:hypothetical protein CPB85DRAFT_1213994 [Mucidula mucida]|nr:hypothetical protein CPB85DRAFT_1213994 [Mucidula mucida]